MTSAHQYDRAGAKSLSVRRRHSNGLAIIAAALLSATVASGATYFLLGRSPQTANPAVSPESDHPEESSGSGIIQLPHSQWDVAGIRIEPAERADIAQAVQVTGKLTLNQDRVAQLYPQVDGIVHDVPVHFGQRVEAGQTLVVIESQQIGTAKLQLIKTRLATQLAEVDYRWLKTVETSVGELVRLLRDGVPLDQIHAQLSGRDMGDYRTQLITAYARLHKSQADYARLKEATENGAIAGKKMLATEAQLEADRATMNALLEQIPFDSRRRRISAEQDLEQARTAEEAAEANLRILGVDDTEHLSERAADSTDLLSRYRIDAPFAGTIIAKDVVLRERIDPDSQLFSIADLSTVWVQADVFERHMALLNDLEDQTIRVHAGAYRDRVFEARIFFTGAVVDPQTRTLPMTAVLDNPQRLLKPGMFVEVELPEPPVVDVLTVADGAIEHHEDQSFVFVHRGDGRFVQQAVSTGAAGGGRVEITAGLSAGDPVVVRGAFFLKSQMLAEQFGDED